jgi:predicted nucleotidyltransferase
VTTLQLINQERLKRREELRTRTRERLRSALNNLLPGQEVIVFGSLTRPGKFQEESDVDIAVEGIPPNLSLYGLTALLAEEVGRPVDVILLPECRFREKIINQGETWMPPH